jgi:hypothetical protein
MPISGPIIEETALKFAQELVNTDGWLGKWKERHSIKEFKVYGESAGVAAYGFKSRILEM